MASFQKPLGWLQRYLYNVESGAVPFPQPSITIDHDWPLDVQSFNRDYVTVAGTVTTELYAPAQELHGLVLFGAAIGSTGAFPATDVVNCYFERIGGAVPNSAMVIATNRAVAAQEVPLIGGVAFDAVHDRRGTNPVYVPYGWRLVIRHTSVAGGINTDCRLVVLERLKSYPLRLP